MSNRFLNTYRIDTARLQQWDYGWNGYYFVTICTNKRSYFFGDVVHGEMVLNDIGSIAKNEWLKITSQFKFVVLDNFVVMPNHVHGILIIDKPDDERNAPHFVRKQNVETRLIASLQENKKLHKESRDNLENENNDKTELIANPKKQSGGITGNKNPMFQENLSRIIRWYKGRISFEARKINSDFAWQPRFYDHIIRDDESYKEISEYIKNNPLNWEKDILKL